MPTKKKTPMSFAAYKAFRERMSQGAHTPTRAEWNKYVRDFGTGTKKKKSSSSKALVVYKPKSQTAIANLYKKMKKATDKKKKGQKMVADAQREIRKIQFAITKTDLKSANTGERVARKCVRQCFRAGEEYGLDLSESYGISVRPSGSWDKQGRNFTSRESKGGKGLINLSITKRPAYTTSSTRMRKARNNKGLRAWTDKLKAVRRSGKSNFVHNGQVYHMDNNIPHKGRKGARR